MSSALRELIEAVERGEFPHDGACAVLDTRPESKTPDWHTAGLCIDAENAFGGSLDAALALHQAVLPGDEWLVHSTGGAMVFRFIGGDVETFESDADTPARAWLLSILRRALASQEPQP